jgi:hypothetical protein
MTTIIRLIARWRSVLFLAKWFNRLFGRRNFLLGFLIGANKARKRREDEARLGAKTESEEQTGESK